MAFPFCTHTWLYIIHPWLWGIFSKWRKESGGLSITALLHTPRYTNTSVNTLYITKTQVQPRYCPPLIYCLHDLTVQIFALGCLFIHAPFQSSTIVLWSLFLLAVDMCKCGRSVVCGVVCISQSEWKPTFFCCQQRNNAGFTETIRWVGMEVFKSIAGIGVAWGTWMCFFCLSLPMTQSRIKGGKMGQNGNQCGCRGVKHDQTAELNRVIILPKNVCVWESDGSRMRLCCITFISCHPRASQCWHCVSPTVSEAEFDAKFWCKNICSWPTYFKW